MVVFILFSIIPILSQCPLPPKEACELPDVPLAASLLQPRAHSSGGRFGDQLGHSLNSFKRGYVRDYIGDYYRGYIKGDTGSLDYGSDGLG